MMMVQTPPQAPVAAASPPTTQQPAGQTAAHQGHDGEVVGQQKPTSTAVQEITRRDVHTASSINSQRRLPKSNAKEPISAHQPAIQRVESKDAPKITPPKSQTPTSSKPVLVRSPSTKPDMKQKHQPIDKSTSPQLPPVESFSFQDILASVGPEVDSSIDAIAEICGRSRMSLAAEHSSHRPPQGQLTTTESSPDSFFLPARLEPVAETSSSRPHTRSMSRSLALATTIAHNGDCLPGSPTAATSNVTSHTHTSTSGHGKGEGTSTSSSLLPQVLAWLRRTNSSTTTEQASASSEDAGALRAMHRLLNDTSEAQL
ncbi:MAG: hypothetical protein ASARMPREDX12_003919 [Alectoria sarmentosa]|nr:MAG: hypothetical protein ASARMPREDX12_003919 [Alectoria sarmentosa]